MLEKKRIKMPGIKSVTVYCGSAPGSDPSYLKLAANLGKAIAAFMLGCAFFKTETLAGRIGGGGGGMVKEVAEVDEVLL